MNPRRKASLAILLAAALIPGPAPAQLSPTLDSGTLIVTRRGRVIATEEFSYDQVGDSLMVSAFAKFKAPRQNADSVEVTKRMALVVNAMDFGLRRYQSMQFWEGHTITNGIEGVGDTMISILREVDKLGDAQRVVLPPGRAFVMDSQLFTLFDVMARNLSRQTFDERPVHLITLGPRSGVTAATVHSGGADTLRWGGRRTITRRLAIDDPTGRFYLWVAPEGFLVRLEVPPIGLRVERQPPPAAKPAGKSAAKPKSTRG